jgi:gas vesicle protein
MKTLFIAALVGLLVVPVVGNATNHNLAKSSYWDQIRSYQQLNKMHQLFVDRFTKAVKDIRDVENGFKGHAKNAPDKIQRDQLLALAAGYEKRRKQLQKDIAVAKRKIRDNQRKICGLYNANERLKHRACHVSQRRIDKPQGNNNRRRDGML